MTLLTHIDSQSGDKFRESLAIKPQFHEALHDWALAFLDRATMKEGPESDALFALSYEKFEQALAINKVRTDLNLRPPSRPFYLSPSRPFSLSLSSARALFLCSPVNSMRALSVSVDRVNSPLRTMTWC